MKAPLSDLAVELRLELSGLPIDSQLSSVIWRRAQLQGWIEQLEFTSRLEEAVVEVLGLERLSLGVAGEREYVAADQVSDRIERALGCTCWTTNGDCGCPLHDSALLEVRDQLRKAHARLDAALSRANQIPARQQADPSRPAPPDGAAMGLSQKAGGQ